MKCRESVDGNLRAWRDSRHLGRILKECKIRPSKNPEGLGYRKTRDMFRQHRAKWPELERCGVRTAKQSCASLRFHVTAPISRAPIKPSDGLHKPYMKLIGPGRHSSAAAVNSEPVQTLSASFLCEQSPILSPQPTLLSSIVSSMFTLRLSTPILAAVSLFMFYAAPRRRPTAR